ncbi:alpha/beta hydrolase [Piscinibacter terrae]|uniref:alpha/beta hydrolase n=1 Tax=Piscinibacter terrae TaxID=2496871 RepID=UPI000F5A1B31|nr:hypothetical protein [Albitalea terrae]
MIHPLRGRGRVSRVLAAAAAAAGFAASPAWADAPCTTVTKPFSQYFSPAPGKYDALVRAANLCYADGTHWREYNYLAKKDDDYFQAFEFYRNKDWNPGQKVPLIIWSHPTGPSQVLMRDSCAADASCPYANRLLQPAIQSGYALMSIQFRHPRASQTSTGVQLDIPNTDIANAVQWVRAHADDMGVDKDNIFLAGQSRGTLALLTAFMNDLGNPTAPDWHSQSSRVNAVFAVQAQTTYEHDELRDLFIEPTTTTPIPPDYPPVFDYHAYLDGADPHFVNPGSALHELDLNDPPFWLRYERQPIYEADNATIKLLGSRVADPGQDVMKDGICYEKNFVKRYPQMDGTGCLDVHNPDFGVALMNSFIALNPKDVQKKKVKVQYGYYTGLTKDLDFVSDHFFDNYTCFFIPNTTAAGEALRQQAMVPGKAINCGIADMAWPPAKP